MVALTVNEARKWRISSRANCLEPEPHQNIAVQAEDKGEADFRRERSDTRLLQVVPGRAAHVCSLLARPIVSLGDAARRRCHRIARMSSLSLGVASKCLWRTP